MSDYYTGPVEVVPSRGGDKPTAAPPRRPRWLWPLVGVLAVGAVVVWLIVHGQSESSRWHFAAAQEKWAAGKREEAYASLQRAIALDPQVPRYYLQQATWLRGTKDYAGALAAIDQGLKNCGDTAELLVERSHNLQHLGRHPEAVETWEKIAALSEAGQLDRSTAMNGLAYAQSLGKLDLEKALRRVNIALKSDPDSAAILDTRGYIYFLMGDLPEAKADLDRAISVMENIVPPGLVVRPDTSGDASLRSQGVNDLLNGLAVMHYHRAQLHEAMGDAAAAKQDLARVRELIHRDPDEHLF